MATVGIIMGSQSDLPVMQEAIDILNNAIEQYKMHKLQPFRRQSNFMF